VAGRFDAAHRRHVEVHHDDVGRELADVHYRLGAGRGLADDLELLLLEQVPQPRPEEVVIVDQQHTERFRLPFLGRFHQLRHREFPLSRRLV
jgi:hypothetical protein